MRKNLLSLALGAGLLLALAANVLAAKIEGSVTDTNGKPIEGMHILVVNASGQVIATGTTGGDGRYEISGVEIGDYRVVVNNSDNCNPAMASGTGGSPSNPGATILDWVGVEHYRLGQVLQPNSNNAGQYFYRCTRAGTSGHSAPQFGQTVGSTTSDGRGVVWTNIGKTYSQPTDYGAAPQTGPACEPGSKDPSCYCLGLGGENTDLTNVGSTVNWTVPGGGGAAVASQAPGLAEPPTTVGVGVTGPYGAGGIGAGGAASSINGSGATNAGANGTTTSGALSGIANGQPHPAPPTPPISPAS